MLNAKIPEGKLQDKWNNYKAHCKIVNPANKKKLDVIIVGAGLAGSSAAATLGELGYNVKVFFFQDSARRAHSVAAQGGVNAAKNYQYDGDNVYRMFYDTIKGGDFRSREANTYRLAECSASLIDQAVAQGVPFAREYGGYLSNRSFGGVQVKRTFYARGQTGQQLLLGAYSAMMRQVNTGRVTLYNRHEMLDVVVIDGKARGIIARDLKTGKIERHAAHTVLLATGGYGKIYYLSTLAIGSNGSAAWRAHKKGAFMAGVSWVQIHPTCLPQSGDYQSKLTLMSESLRNDGRIWVSKIKGDDRHPNDINAEERDYYLERRYPAFGNLAPRDIASRAAKERIDAGHGVGANKNAVYLDFKTAIGEYGEEVIRERYGNLFRMYEKITGINAYKEPMKISPAAHFTMGGLWVDYELMTTVPGLFALGESNFSDHGANRLGANSLLQACVDGYFIAPLTVGNYLAGEIKSGKISTDHPEFEKTEQEAVAFLDKLVNIKGNKTADHYHKKLGRILWDKVGLERSKEGLEEAIRQIRELKNDFWHNLMVPGTQDEVNSELEKAGRVADYIELAELMAHDALNREESCGAHFRTEYQTEDGEAMRNDQEFAYVSSWEHQPGDQGPKLHKEMLEFEMVTPSVRSYK
ncbi:MAG: fumarate reductase/succinate dehydrogenase flavoprotein subunit [Saprospiraceae bacterium]|nr:fumarate reductase/succinate dehydrogenase flavoprotein subunit [Saprospiraceae bacterium]MCB9326122.1 fumarate reductase/succinate dehydrogenase flavoprotein subunit [Lewinellaceae bacterium]